MYSIHNTHDTEAPTDTMPTIQLHLQIEFPQCSSSYRYNAYNRAVAIDRILKV